LSTWLNRHPDDQFARSYAARALMLANRNHEAISHYEYLLKSNPNNASALNNLAVLYQRVNDTRDLATAERAFKLAQNNSAIQDTLGWILIMRGQNSNGLNYLSKAATAAPKVAEIQYHYGVGLARVGKKTEAKKAFEKAIKNGLKVPELDKAKEMLNTP